MSKVVVNTTAIGLALTTINASNADSIETALDFFDDEEQKKFLRVASLSQRWIFYGIKKE